MGKMYRVIFVCCLLLMCQGCSSFRVMRQDVRVRGGGSLSLYGLCYKDSIYFKWPGIIGTFSHANFDAMQCSKSSKLIQQSVKQMNNPKPVVHYIASDLSFIKVGYRAIVMLGDGSGTVIHTLQVLSVESDGSFETSNSVYVLMPQQ